MVGFHLGWVVALAMVAYADVVDGGCRDDLRLLGPVEEQAPAGDVRSGFDAWQDAFRRWRQRSGGRVAGSEADGLGPVPRHPQHP